MQYYLKNVFSSLSEDTRMSAVRVAGALNADMLCTPFPDKRPAIRALLITDYALTNDTFELKCSCSTADLARVDIDEKFFLSCPSFINPVVAFSAAKAQEISRANAHRMRLTALPLLETIYKALEQQCKEPTVVDLKSHRFVVKVDADLARDYQLGIYIYRKLLKQGWRLNRMTNWEISNGRFGYYIYTKK